jgi:hypothetical protein
VLLDKPGQWLATLGISAALLVSLSGTAQAQRDTEARAAALFTEGRALLEKGDCPAAIDRFLAALRLTESVGAHLSAGDCYEHTDPAAAWRQYRAAERASRALGDERAAVAQSRAAALEPQIAILSVVVPTTPGLEVRIDG